MAKIQMHVYKLFTLTHKVVCKPLFLLTETCTTWKIPFHGDSLEEHRKLQLEKESCL